MLGSEFSASSSTTCQRQRGLQSQRRCRQETSHVTTVTESIFQRTRYRGDACIVPRAECTYNIMYTVRARAQSSKAQAHQHGNLRLWNKTAAVLHHTTKGLSVFGALAGWRVGALAFHHQLEHGLQTFTTSLNAIYRSGVKLNYLR